MRIEDVTMILRQMLVALGFVAVPTSMAGAHDNVPAPAQSSPIVISGGTIHTISGADIANGRLRFEKGKLIAVGGSEVSTDGARVVDVSGKHVYPGLIAANSVLGLVEVSAVRATLDTTEVGFNAANVRAEVAVNPDSELIPVTRSNGVLLALSVPQAGGTGVISGTSALLQLEGWSWEDMTIKAPVGLHVLWPSRFIPAGFPADMAEAARKAAKEKRDALSQAFEDARAYAAQGGPRIRAADLRLAAMLPFLDGKQPVFFHADDVQSIDDALDFASENKLRAILVGGAEAWRAVDRLRAQNVAVIIGGTHALPLRRSDAVDAVYANATRLAAAGVRFAMATAGDGFDTSNLRNLPYQAATAVAYGLDREEALKAITLYPAQILGVDDRVGSLEIGKDATLFVTDGDPMDARTQVERAWIAGREIDLANRQSRLYEKYRQKYPQTRDAH
jgi:imidazolonepropionase-like amidohydrolase